MVLRCIQCCMLHSRLTPYIVKETAIYGIFEVVIKTTRLTVFNFL